MPRETKEQTIDGVQYRVTQLGMKTADEFVFRVLRIAAAGIFESPEAIAVALQGLPLADYKWALATLQDATQVLVVDEAAGANAKGETPARWVKLPLVYDDHFTGDHMGAWFDWLTFALEVCFGRFFGGLRERMRRRTEASRSASPKASPGSSGESSPATG